jgi:hypothetical protein
LTVTSRSTRGILAFILAFAAMMFATQIQPEPASASHFRGSLVTVEYHAPSGAHSAEVHISSTTLTESGSSGGMSRVRVFFVTGGVPAPVNGCSGTSNAQTTTDTSNPLFDIQVDEFTIDGCFGTPGEYIFEADTCCRISGIENTPNNDIQFSASLLIDGVNDSEAPTFSSGYMYNIAYEANLSYSTNLGGLGQGNTAVTYELVTDTSSTLDGFGATRIPCSDLNLTTGAYRIDSSFCTGAETIASAFGGGAKYYALKVRAIDTQGQYSTRDVLLYFDTTTNLPPAFTTVPAAGAFTVTPGTSATAQFCAQDPDVADTLNFTFSPTRSWITIGAVTPVSPATTPNTYCVDFTVAPPVGTSEAFNFEVSVFDNNNSFVRSASNLYSLQAGAVLPNNAPVATVFVPTAPQVTSINPRLIPLDTAQLVKISGERLAGVTKFTVRGITLTVKSNSAGEIVFEMPAQQVEGFADLYFETPQGNLSFSQALFFSASKSTTQGSAVKPSVVSGFNPGSFAITASLRVQMNKLVGQLREYKSISCTGYAMGPTVLARDAALAKSRAAAVCAYLKKALSSQVSTSTRGAQDLAVGSVARRVEILGSK